MSTINIRDKINLLESQIQQEEQQRFAQQLIVEDAAQSTGDPELDRAFEASAANARATMRACEHRLERRQQKLGELKAELDAEKKPGA